MLTKCFGIISYFPDGELREIRKQKFYKLLETLDTYFKLPLVIIAQNWDDIDLKYSNSIKIYKYTEPLGVTGARIALREKLLEEDYDYYIFLDDDIEIRCNQKSVNNYLKNIDAHPGMFGKFDKFQLFAISKYMLEKMNFDYIKDYESIRGEIWEDVAYYETYRRLYPKKFWYIKVPGLELILPKSQDDPTSTWYNSDIDQEELAIKTEEIIKSWLAYWQNLVIKL